MKKSAIGGLVFGLVLVPFAAAWGEPPYRHMPTHSVAHGGDACCGVSSCCPDPCAPRCCIGLIPAVLNGVDRLLSHVFCGRCYDPCCMPVASGCSDCGESYPMMPAEMASRHVGPGTMGPTRAQQVWDIPRGSAPRVSRTPGKPTPARPTVAERSVMKPKLAEAPQPRPAAKSQPARSKPIDGVAEVERAETAPFRESGQIQRTSFQTSRDNRLPSNPLR